MLLLYNTTRHVQSTSSESSYSSITTPVLASQETPGARLGEVLLIYPSQALPGRGVALLQAGGWRSQVRESWRPPVQEM